MNSTILYLSFLLTSRAYGGIWYLFKSGDFQKSFDQLQKVLTVDMMNSKGK